MPIKPYVSEHAWNLICLHKEILPQARAATLRAKDSRIGFVLRGVSMASVEELAYRYSVLDPGRKRADGRAKIELHSWAMTIPC